MDNYVGHISVSNGKITIDLAQDSLCDGVYSIIQESESKAAKRRKCKFNPTYKPYDKETFTKELIALVGDRKVSLVQISRELDMPKTTLNNRCTKLNLHHLFTQKRS
jgi:hypothetical protein